MTDLFAHLDHEDLSAESDTDVPHNGEHGRLFGNAEIRRFILAGNAVFTVRSRRTGNRFTFRVRASQDGQCHFVSLMTGPDNVQSYSYFGFIRREVYFHGGRKARVEREAPGAVAFEWLWRLLVNGNDPDQHQAEIWHEGRCGRCHRRLTVPSSIASGIGPECAGRIGVGG